MGKHSDYEETRLYKQAISDIIIITKAIHRGFIIDAAIRSIWGSVAYWLTADEYTTEVLSQQAVSAREYLWCMDVGRYMGYRL